LIDTGLGWIALGGSDVGNACGMNSNTARHFLRNAHKHLPTAVLVPSNTVDTSMIPWWKEHHNVTHFMPLSLLVIGLCRMTKDHHVRAQINNLFGSSHSNVALFTALLNSLRDAILKTMSIQTDARYIPLGMINLLCITPEAMRMVATGQTLPTNIVASLLHSSLIQPVVTKTDNTNIHDEQQPGDGIQRWRSHDTYCNLANPFVILPEVNNIPTDHHKLAYDLMSIGSYITSDIATKPSP
jgi:hypothetical protein